MRRTNELQWGAMWCGEAWHMWCEMFITDDAMPTEAGYVRFSPIEYPHNCPPSADEIMRHVPVLKQQLALKLADKQREHAQQADIFGAACAALVRP
jgi:hypothetical protein